MKNIELRRAGAQDVDLLVDLRKTVLIAANKLPADADLSHLDAACAAYFADTDRQTTFLALDGAGGGRPAARCWQRDAGGDRHGRAAVPENGVCRREEGYAAGDVRDLHDKGKEGGRG